MAAKKPVEQVPNTTTPDNTETISGKKEIIVGLSVLIGIVALIVGIIFIVQNATPKITYQPPNACDLLTLEETMELLGDNTLRTNSSDEVIVSGNTATSKCGYTNGDAKDDTVIVAAIIIRSGINDKGVEQNKTEFAAGKPTDNVETIADLGDSAYFDKIKGQLNVLDDKNWIIISYGLASLPDANDVSDAIDLARRVVVADSVKF